MATVRAGLVWWQWIVVVFFGVSNAFSPVPRGPADLLGALVGSFLGAFVIVFILAKLSRGVRGFFSARKEAAKE